MMVAGRIVVIAFFALLAAGCDILSPSKKGNVIHEQIPTTFRTTDVEGLEQTLVVSPPKGAVDDAKLLGVESVVANRGAFSIKVITRACVFLPEDFSGVTITLTPDDPPDCGGRSADTLDLLPGQSTPVVSGRFRIDGVSPGIIELKLKHILKPAFLINFRFQLN